MSYDFKEMHLTVNVPDRKVQKIKALVMHYTANTGKGAGAVANRNYFQNHPKAKASANYTVDDSTVVECAPVGMVTWHAGGSRYTSYAKENFALSGKTQPNDFTVGYEMCNNSDSDWDTTVSNTIELAAKHIVEHNLGDVDIIRHYDVTSKSCPKPMVDDAAAWESFKKRLWGRVSELKGEKPEVEKPVKPEEDKLDSSYGIVEITTKAGLNMRAGIGTSYAVIGAIPFGKQVNYMEEHKGWLRVKFNGKIGWCSKDYVKVIKALVEKKYGKVTASVLNVRNGRSTSHKVIGTLKNGETVRLASKIGDWYSIYFGENGGFVHGDYIKEL